MYIIRSILLALEVIVSLLLILIILMQKSKSAGGGMGTAFGGGMSETLFGSRAGNVLTKGTIILTVIFLANTVVLAILVTNQHTKTLMDTVGEGTPASAPPAAAAPGQATRTLPAQAKSAAPTLPANLVTTQPAPQPEASGAKQAGEKPSE